MQVEKKNMQKNSYIGQRFFIALGLLLGTLTIGTTGYVVIEDVSLVDAIYMTVVTVSTVGYQEIFELSLTGRIFTMFIIILGAGCVCYATLSMLTLLISGELNVKRRRNKMQKRVNSMKNHVIICGYGRMGKSIVEQICNDMKVVIIEKDSSKTDNTDIKALFVTGDAAEEETLQKAGVAKAKALVSTLPRDSDNVYVALTASSINQNLFIISRTESHATEARLLRAGADRVICPQSAGARRVAGLLVRPNIVDFVNVATQDIELEVVEYEVTEESVLAGKSLRELALRQKADAMVVAIKRKDSDEETVIPQPEKAIKVGDLLILVGKLGASERLAKLT
jgi:voltage-gated potassium channel